MVMNCKIVFMHEACGFLFHLFFDFPSYAFHFVPLITYRPRGLNLNLPI